MNEAQRKIDTDADCGNMFESISDTSQSEAFCMQPNSAGMNLEHHKKCNLKIKRAPKQNTHSDIHETVIEKQLLMIEENRQLIKEQRKM